MGKLYNKFHNDAPDDAVYIGRPSLFGNAFTHMVTNRKDMTIVGSREEAVEFYRKWFEEKIEHDPEFKAAVETLRGVDLVCWCAPLPCHGDVILEYLEKTDGHSDIRSA